MTALPSASPYRDPGNIDKNKSDDLGTVCDYLVLNEVTVKYLQSIPLIEDTVDQVSGPTIFRKLDLVDGYYQLRIKDGDVRKSASYLNKVH